MPTGRVLAHAPAGLGFAGEDTAFTEPLPSGEHPVRLSVLRCDDGSTRVATVRVDAAGADQAASWEMALRPGESLAEGWFHGTHVDGDSGLVGLCDAASLPGLADLLTDPDRDPNLLIGYTERERERLAERERRLQESARALLVAPGTQTAQEFAEAVSDSLEGELEFRDGPYTLLRLAHAIARTEDPGPPAAPGSRDTSPWFRVLRAPEGGELLAVLVDRVGPCPVWLGRDTDGRAVSLVLDARALDRPADVYGTEP
ncbi:DUF4241 domain-containing protein [Nocardiopsis sp. LOL_012]|uniref:DUF4241 domain-containing protein n=1 Tax=Nocardiopsis sp. LOL_012 TaxID=3345409 RepID=UPI003A85DC47